MSKKTNTLLFVLAATIFNILVTLLCGFALLMLYSLIQSHIPEKIQEWAFPLIFIPAIVASFFIYRFALKFLMKKIDIEKYFDPIFGSRRKQPEN